MAPVDLPVAILDPQVEKLDPEVVGDDEKVKSIEDEERSDESDGGLDGWLAVTATFFANVATIGLNASFGTFQEHYARNQLADRSASAISWIGSIQTALLLGVGIISGRLYDKSYLKATLMAGSALLVTGVFVQSICDQYWSLMLVQGVLQGLGMGLLFTPGWAAAFSWFTRRQGLAIGILASGSGIGGIAWSQMLSRLFASMGYRNAVLVLGGCITACLAVTLALSRAKSLSASAEKTPLLNFRPLRDPVFTIFIAGALINSLAIWLPWTYLPTFATQQGFSTSVGNSMLTVFNASAVIGRLVACSIGDVVGATNMFCSIILACAALYTSFYSATSRGALIAWSILGGFFAGADLASGPAAMASLSRRHKHEAGLRSGLMFGTESIAALASGPIGGAILARDGTWLGVSLYSGGAFLVCFVLTFVSRTMFARQIGLKRV